MNNKELENKISSALRNMVPENSFKELSEKIILPQENERTGIKMTVKKNSKIKKFAIPAIAACLILVIGGFGGLHYANNVAIDSVIDIDVNPSIELKTSKKDKVISAVAVNNDGNDILDGMNLNKVDLDVAVNAIIGSMVQKGYVINETSGILVTVQNADSAKAEKIRTEVLSNIDKSLTELKVDAPVINQTLTDASDAEKFAVDNKISLGKAVFVLNLAAKDSSLKAEELAQKSIREIAGIITNKKIDIKDIVDYDFDDSIWENIADTIEDVNEDVYGDDDDSALKNNASETDSSNQNNSSAGNTSSKTETALITAEKAKEAALSHAGLSADAVKFIRAELDEDDGVLKYEIEFKKGSYEYEYKINAKTGKVIKAEKDVDDDRNIGSTQNSSVSQSNSSASSSTLITAEKAKEAALSHAGLSADAVKFIKAELDEDDGVLKYEIEFKKGSYEYEYKINAKTGKVIEAEKDVDDD